MVKLRRRFVLAASSGIKAESVPTPAQSANGLDFRHQIAGAERPAGELLQARHARNRGGRAKAPRESLESSCEPRHPRYTPQTGVRPDVACGQPPQAAWPRFVGALPGVVSAVPSWGNTEPRFTRASVKRAGRQPRRLQSGRAIAYFSKGRLASPGREGTITQIVSTTG
jgi:hypothetical protein